MEEDQTKFLENALYSVKTYSTQMKNSISKNDIRECLKHASEMLSELKTNLLTPKNYYQLYTTIFDELQILQNYFREETKRGRRVKELYEAVQQSINIIPRVFLLITVGGIYIESDQCDKEELIYDMIQMTKGIQHPLRGLFARYFLLKMIKDFIQNEKENIEKYVDFILEIFQDMNILWIRLNNINDTNYNPEEDIENKKLRNDLKVLVGENITRLSSLQYLTKDLYKNKILPSVLKIAISCDDTISQYYIVECIIHAFPDEYNLLSFAELIDSIKKMNNKLDIKSLYIAIMDKMSKYFTDNTNENIIKNSEEVFEIMKKSIQEITIESDDSDNKNMDILKIIELNIAFLNFTNKCNTTEETKILTINSIITNSYDILNKNKGDKKMSKEGITIIMKILNLALDSPISIFEIKNFPDLMIFLDQNNQSALSLKIVDNLVNDYNLGIIDTKDKMMSILELVKPLLDSNFNPDNNNNDNKDNYQKETEQAILSKIMYIPCSHDPNEQLDIYNLLKNTFLSSNEPYKLKYSVPAVINSYLSLAMGVSEAYASKKSENNNKNKIQKNYENNYILDKFDDNNIDSYYNFFKTIYESIIDVLNIFIGINPECTCKLYFSLILQINILKVKSDKYEDLCFNYLMDVIKIIKNKISQNKQFELLIELTGTISQLNIIKKEKYIVLCDNLIQISQNLFKRSDQCISMINISKLYYNKILKEKEKVNECLTKAKKYADYAMTSPMNSILFIHIINQYINFDLMIDEFDKLVKADTINDLIEFVKNYIQTMKNENKNQKEAEYIDKYFKSTLDMIKDKQNKKLGKLITGIETGK